MTSPTMGGDTTTSQIQVLFTALNFGQQTGGAIIDSYNLQWDQGTNNYVDLTGQDGAYQLGTSFTVTSGVSGGKMYKFQVRAHNPYGWGPFSVVFQIYATNVPAQPATLTTSALNTNVLIQWIIPFNNYEAIDAYRVLIKSSNGVFIEEPISCNGAQFLIFATQQCTVPMTTLTSATYGMIAGDMVVAKVQAHNSRGWGPLSVENSVGAILVSLPFQMAAPARDSQNTNPSQVTVTWTALNQPQNGMATISSYELVWDAGSSGLIWSSLIGFTTDSLALTFTASTGVSPGGYYKFKVRAKNYLGWGAYSAESTIRAATIPSQMQIPTTSLDSSTGNILIQFQKPSDNSQTITAYQIQLQSNGIWYEDMTNCSGANVNIIANLQCSISMNYVLSIGLIYSNIIPIQVRAYNAFGWGAFSSTNTQQTVRTIPQAMLIPTRDSSTSPSILSVLASALIPPDGSGNSTITSYHFQWDQNTNGINWYDLQGFTTNSLLTSLWATTNIIPGAFYQIRVRAKNIYGFGSYSPILTIQAANQPQQILQSSLSSVINGVNVVLSWTAPFNNYATVTAYRILIQKSDTTFAVEPNYCDGGVDANILTNNQCTIPIQTLRALPFSLLRGSSVIFSVQAYNIYGWSDLSQSNTLNSAIIQTEPDATPIPIYNPTSSTLTSIAVSWSGWTDGTNQAGLTTILSYNLQFKLSSDSTWTNAQGMQGAYSKALSGVISSGIVGGSTYNIQILVNNIQGWSPASPILTVVASGIPNQPSYPTTTLQNSDVKISWTAPTSNYATITSYQILIQNSAGTLIQETTYCDGSINPVLSSLSCMVPMSRLRSTYSLSYGTLVQVKIKAFNINGWSSISDPNPSGVLIQTEPNAMVIPTEGSLTNPTQIEVQWTPLTTAAQIGGSSLLTYNLQYNSGNGVWVDLIGDFSYYLGTSYIFSNSIVRGQSYNFQVRAKNYWGPGSFSPIAQIIASTMPQQPNPVTTTFVEQNNVGYLQISWTAPDDQGSPINQYLIQVQDASATSWITPATCDGSLSSIITARSCLIPMSSLIISPYFYTYNQLVIAKIQAKNIKGWSSYSNLNTIGATMASLPQALAAPTRGSQTLPSQIQVNWAALTSGIQQGGGSILSYQLMYDSGSGQAFGDPMWVTLIGYPSNYLLTSYTVTGATITGGNTYQFAVRAQTTIGWGPWSSIAQIVASSAPNQMTAPTVSIDSALSSKHIKIAWTAPASNNNAITAYQVLILKSDGSTYLEETTDCDASTPTIFGQMYCLVPMTTLITNYNLLLGNNVIAKVRAQNGIGFSDFSQPNSNGATIQTEPLQMAAPTRTSVTLSTISVAWIALIGSNTGNYAIDSYNIQYKLSTSSSWTDLQGQDGNPSILLSYSLNSLQAGQTYQFRVRAHNIHGWGVWSNTASILTSTFPDKPNTVTTQLQNSYVQISWTSPNNNYLTISAYEISIKNVQGLTYFLDTTNCDASYSQIVQNMYCLIPVSVLRSDPFNLVLQSLVIARVRARNDLGWSDYSLDNTVGALIQTEPSQMSTPTRGSSTNTNQLKIDWNLLSTPQNGYSDVQSYALYWDSGNGGTSFANLVGEGTNYQLANYVVTSGVARGLFYQFKIRAKNYWGWSVYSNILTIKAATIPLFGSNPPSTSVTSGNIIAQWDAADNQGDTITIYKVQIQTSDGASWIEETANCGKNNQLTCSIPMTVFTSSSPYNYAQGNLIILRIIAQNSFGDSLPSQANTIGATAQVKPATMNNPTRGSQTTTSQIEVVWNVLTGSNTGDSPITSYQLVWDNGSGTTNVDLVGIISSYVGTSYIVSVSGPAGTPYKFKVRARNIYDWGPYSIEVTILSSQAPSQMQVITTTNTNTNVQISWTAPSSNGETITAYDIQIQKSDGTYSSELTNCNGADSTILSAMQCTIPMSTFLNTYGLTLGTLIKVKARAYNNQGFGDYSQPNSAGALIQTVPGQVQGVNIDTINSNSNQITMTWTLLTSSTDVGGSPLTAQQIWSAVSSGSPSYSLESALSPSATSYTKTGVTPGQTYLFQVRATNIYGTGAFSSAFSALAAQIPDQPSAPTTDQVSTSIKVSWTAPFNQYQPILDYQIQIGDSSGNFAVNSALCDGTNQLVISNMFCLIPITSLTSAPYNFQINQLLVFKVRARNSRGYGAYSVVNTAGILAQTIPSQMGNPSSDSSVTAESLIKVQWTALSSSLQTGGSSITSYHLQWDAGNSQTSTFIDLIGFDPASLATSLTLATSIVAGQTYRFKVRASNIFGWGSYSQIVSLKAAREPYQMTAPTTSIDSTTGALVISWIQPSTGSDPISQYKIEIQTTNNGWYIDTTNCNGQNSVVLLALKCSIPMLNLQNVPYELPFNTLVIVRATAQNSFGWGQTSLQNTNGAYTRKLPVAMGSLSLTSVTDSSISLSWIALAGTDTGNSLITSYNIYWDNGSGTLNLPLMDSLVTSYTISGLTGGTNYNFYIRAANIYGYGSFSPTLSVLASSRPEKMNIASVTIGSSQTFVTVSWTQPNYHFSAIQQYDIKLQTSTGSFVNDLTNCNGQSNTVISALSCTIPMTNIIAITSLSVDSLIRVQIRAQNVNGWGDYSELNTNGATIETTPSQLSTPVFNQGGSSMTSIDVSWNILTGIAKGGSNVNILSYKYEIDQGTGTWTVLANPTTNSYLASSLTTGTTYQFRVTANNKYGLGPVSNSISVVSADIPSTPSAVTTSETSIYIRVQWTAPAANGIAISAYKIEFLTSSGNYITDNTNCDGTTDFIINNQYCLIPMSSIWSYQTQGNLFQARVSAQNLRGWSGTSTLNNDGALIEVQPLQISSLTRGSATSSTSVQVNWVAVTAPNDGGSPVLGYAIYTDNATSGVTFTELAGYSQGYTATTFTMSTGVVAAQTYQFKIMAKNQWGWGPFSSAFSVLAASVPYKVSTVTTSIDSATGGVQITWTAPFNGGMPITSYVIEIQTSTSTWAQQTTFCNGANNVIINALSCIIPMSTLSSATGIYQLSFQQLVVVRVSAINTIGQGSSSDVNTAGAQIRQVPNQMSPPTKGSQTTETQIQVNWNAVTASGTPTGDSPITSYQLLWDNGNSLATTFIQLTNSLVTTYTVIGLTPGNQYRFQVRAQNIYGQGGTSTILTVVAEGVPSKMNSITTTNNGLYLQLNFAMPTINGAPITGYQIVILSQTTSSYIEDTTYCNGADSNVKSNLQCQFLYTYLISQYGYTIGQLAVFKARAQNQVGWGAYSDPNTSGDTVKTVPVQMAAPTEDSTTSATQIKINWVGLSSTANIGGTSITSYELDWDQGTGNFVDLVGASSPFTSTTYTLSSGITAGTSYVFYVRAWNALGSGQFSNTITIIPSSAPLQMDPVTTSIISVLFKISWAAPNNQGAAVSAYKIFILQSDGQYSEQSTYCNGASPTIVTNRYCTIPMSILKAAPYNYLNTNMVVATVQALNIKGWSTLSSANTAGALIEDVPNPPTGLQWIQAQTDDSQVTVTWNQLTSTIDVGGATCSIFTYILQWQTGTESWISLVGISPLNLATTFTVTSNVVGGTLYNFRVYARNKYGPSLYSSIASVYASAIPDTALAPVTSLDDVYTRITWELPNAHSLPVTAYQILILQKDGTTWTESSQCLGTSNTIIQNLYCRVSMISLRSSPFNLVLNDPVYAKIKSRNAIGWSENYSSASSVTSTIATEPQAPTNPPYNGAGTNTIQIQVQWDPLTGLNAGNSVVTLYEVYWDAGLGDGTWLLLTTETTGSFTYTFTQTQDIYPGITYLFRYRATNAQGTGDWSSSGSIVPPSS